MEQIELLLKERIQECHSKIRTYSILRNVINIPLIFTGVISTTSASISYGLDKNNIQIITIASSFATLCLSGLAHFMNISEKLNKYRSTLVKLEDCLITLHEHNVDYTSLKEKFEHVSMEMSQISNEESPRVEKSPQTV